MRLRRMFAWGLAGTIGYAATRSIMRSSRRIDFRGRVAVIAGGSRGLGLELARQLAFQGARVCLLARSDEDLSRAAAEIGRYGTEVVTIACDIASESEVQSAVDEIVDRFGRIDLLLNVAGIISVGPWDTMLAEDYEAALQTHVWGPLRLIYAVVPHMRRLGGGRIVNISSIGGLIGIPHLAPYCASKFALVGLSEALAAELRTQRIYVTTVCPGLMRTGSATNAWFKGQHAKEFFWFAWSASSPLAATEPRRAARQILEAMRYGDAQLTISLPAKFASLAQRVAPELVADLGALVARLLPRSGSEGQNSHSGWESTERLPDFVLRRLRGDAEAHNNAQRTDLDRAHQLQRSALSARS